MSNSDNENELMEDLINKKNSQNEKYKIFLDDKIRTWISKIDNNINKEIDNECLIENKEIKKLKSYSHFDINKYKSFVSI